MTLEKAKEMLAERGLALRLVDLPNEGIKDWWVLDERKQIVAGGRTWQEAFANATNLAPY